MLFTSLAISLSITLGKMGACEIVLKALKVHTRYYDVVDLVAHSIRALNKSKTNAKRLIRCDAKGKVRRAVELLLITSKCKHLQANAVALCEDTFGGKLAVIEV